MAWVLAFFIFAFGMCLDYIDLINNFMPRGWVESADQVRIKCNFQFTMLNEGTHVTIIFKSLWKIHFCSQSRWKFNRICSALFQVLFGTSTVPHISGGLEMTKKYVKRPVQVKRNEGLESLDWGRGTRDMTIAIMLHCDYRARGFL